MKKILLTLILGLFLISLIGAAQDSLRYPINQNGCFDIIQTCADCTYNNVTSIKYPNGTTLLFSPEQNMTETGTNYIFNTCDFSGQLGTYIVNGQGDLSGTNTIWNYEYEITPTGESLDTQQSILILGLILVLLFLTCAFLYFGSHIESVSIKLFLITLGGLFLMVTIGVSLNTIRQLMLVGSVFSGVFLGLYILILALISIGFIGLVLYLITFAVKAFQKSRGADFDND